MQNQSEKKKGNQSRKQCMVYFIKMASVIAVLSLLQHFCSFKNSYSPGSLSGLIREKFLSKSFLSLSTIWLKFPSRELLSLCFSKCFSPGKVTHFIFFHASSNAQVTSNAVFWNAASPFSTLWKDQWIFRSESPF